MIKIWLKWEGDLKARDGAVRFSFFFFPLILFSQKNSFWLFSFLISKDQITLESFLWFNILCWILNLNFIWISRDFVINNFFFSSSFSQVATTCPQCRNSIQTGTRYEIGTMTWLACIGLWFFTGCLCFIPFFMNGLKDVVHFCPGCQNVLGRYNRM